MQKDYGAAEGHRIRSASHRWSVAWWRRKSAQRGTRSSCASDGCWADVGVRLDERNVPLHTARWCIACQFGCLLVFCLLEWDRKRAPQGWQGRGCPRTCGNSKMHGSQKMRTKAMLVVSLLMTSKGMPVQCVVFGAMQVPCAFIYYCMNLVGGVLAFSHQIWMGTVRHAASVSKRLGEELRV